MLLTFNHAGSLNESAPDKPFQIFWASRSPSTDLLESLKATMSDDLKTLAEPKKLPTLTADEQLLHSLGYKQEFKREFTAFEVFGWLPLYLTFRSMLSLTASQESHFPSSVFFHPLRQFYFMQSLMAALSAWYNFSKP